MRIVICAALSAALVVLVTGQSRSSSISASPGPLFIVPFPGLTKVLGNSLNAVADLLRPAPLPPASEATHISRRLLQHDVAPLQPIPSLAYLTCTGKRNETNITSPAPIFYVSDWCFLVHLQPQVLAAFATLRSEVIFVPTDAAFQALLRDFPAFYEWLAALPSCAARFNRMEYFLYAHATSVNVSCYGLRCSNLATSPPFRTLNAPAWEKLRLALLTTNGVPTGCVSNQ